MLFGVGWIIAGLFAIQGSLAAQSQETYKLIFAADDLPLEDIAKLEKRLKKKPEDRSARIRLLSYYSRVLARTDAKAAAAGRIPHLTWIVSNTPDDDVLDYSYLAAVNSRGSSLPDPELHQQILELWQEHLQSPQVSAEALTHAATFLSVEEPESAAAVLNKIPPEKLSSPLARFAGLCAHAILGLKGFDHLTGRPTWEDPSLRESSLAKECRANAESDQQPEFVAELARLYYRAAGNAYADSTLTPDYTAFGAPLLDRARRLKPNVFELQFVPAESLPQRGETFPATIQMGGEPMKQRLISQVDPEYPIEARRKGIEGVVELDAAVGPSGDIVALTVADGPVELREAATTAVRQWKYKPASINGNPVYTVTRISVTFAQ